jgi:long-chain acyl-CoA synthetase
MANIASHLFRQAHIRASKTALIFGPSTFTFAQIHSQVCRIAAGLSHAGFKAGDKLAIMLAAGAEFIASEYAAFALGGVVVPLNPHYKAGELEYALRSCEVDYLIIQNEFASLLGDAGCGRLAALRHVWILGGAVLEPGTSRVSSADALVEHRESIASVTERGGDDLALMLHTSATTGKAKGVMLTVDNLQSNYDATPGWLGLSDADRILCALPLYNTFALNQCINATMVTGATMVLLPRFDVMECLAAIQANRCTFFPAVPTMLQKLLNDPRVGDFDITSMRRLLVGAAPVPATLLESVYRTMGPQTVVMTGYGLTEACALVSLEHVSLDADGNLTRPKSVGQVLPGMQMIVGGPEGEELEPGEIGEILIKGPNVMKGYFRLDAETAAAVVHGWLRTGDLGIMDAERHFYIVDRKKDLIIRGGQNIYPADVEEVLYSHPAVAEAVVIGRSDDVLGEVPEAYVAFKPGALATVEELMSLCRSELAYFKVPKSIHILNELPKGPTGKILRRGLRQAAPAFESTR